MSYFPTLDTNLNHVQALDDLPNQTGGLTAAELKAVFDQAGNDIKDYINGTLLKALESVSAGSSGAEGIGFPPDASFPTVNNVLSALTYLRTIVQSGNVDDNDVYTNAIQDGAVTEPKLATDAVTNAKIKNGEVTPAKCDFTGADLTIGSSSKKLTIDGPLVLSTRAYGDYSDRPVSPEAGQIYFVKVGTTP